MFLLRVISLIVLILGIGEILLSFYDLKPNNLVFDPAVMGIGIIIVGVALLFWYKPPNW
jgi:hypothetical protein